MVFIMYDEITAVQRFFERHFDRSVIPTRLYGGSVNTMWEVSLDGRNYILRVYPEFFQEKLNTELSALESCKQFGFPTPRVVIVDTSKSIIPTTALVLEKIEGENLQEALPRLNEEDIENILCNVYKLLEEMASKINVEHIGYLHEPSYKGGLYEYIRQKTEEFSAKVIGVIGEKDLERFKSILQRLNIPNKPEFTYVDLSPKNIIVKDGKFEGLIDFEFIMGADHYMGQGNFALKTRHTEWWEAVSSSIKTLPGYPDIFRYAIYRGLELLSYMPETKLYEESEKQRRIKKIVDSINALANDMDG